MEYEVRNERQTRTAIAAGSSQIFAPFTVPQGFCAFVDRIWCVPDSLNHAVNARPRIGANTLEHLNFSVNGAGMNMLRPFMAASRQKPIDLGEVPRIGVINDPTKMTALPVSPNETFDIQVFADATGVSTAIEIGYRIHIMDNEYLQKCLSSVYSSAFNVTDVFKGLSIRQEKAVPVDVSKVRELPGGDKQSTPRIRNWIRYCTNFGATTASQDYLMSDTANALNNLDLKFDEKTTLVLEALGIAPHANHLITYTRIGERVYPVDMWATDPVYNELPFGDDLDFLGPVPIQSGSLLAKIWNKSLKFYIRDNGTIIGAGGTMIGLWGKLIELGG